MSDTIPTSKTSWISFAAVISGFALFLLIVAIAYLPKTPEPIAEGTKTPEQRKAALAELRGKEKTAVSTYAWLDREKGVVQLPVDRAVELTIQEVNAKRK